MYWLILFGWVGFAATAFVAIFGIRDSQYWGDTALYTFMAAAIGSLIAFFLALIASLIAMSVLPTHMAHEIHGLKNISDGTATHGSFFLGSGSIDDNPTFFYYEIHKDGSYTFESVDAKYAKIIESDEPPHLDISYKVTNNSNWSIFSRNHHFEDHYTFYVPKNSVVSNFHLDGVDSTPRK